MTNGQVLGSKVKQKNKSRNLFETKKTKYCMVYLEITFTNPNLGL